MDRNVTAAQRLEDGQAAAADEACNAAAQLAGFTPKQADACDDMALACPTCPWSSRSVDIAINHDPRPIAPHALNADPLCGGCRAAAGQPGAQA